MNWGRHPGWGWKRELIFTLVIGLAIAGWMVAVDKAWPESKIEGPVTLKLVMCDGDNGVTCDRTHAKRQARRFRHDRLGNSHELRFGKRVKRKIRRWYANHPSTAKTIATDGHHWWQMPFDTAICLTNGSHSTWDCATKGDSAADTTALRHDLEATTRLSVKCGGAAVIGSIKGGGWWGAGKGAGVCLWFVLFQKF